MKRSGWERSLLTAVAALALSAILPPALYAGTCTGVVYLDANTNGERDEGESGVAGCTVSADCPAAPAPVFAVSGEDGGYALELPDAPATIFVVNRSGMWPTGDWWHYTADGSEGGDFGLRLDEQSTPFNVVHATDMHITPETVDSYRRYLEHVAALPVDLALVIHTGDLTLDTNRSTPEEARERFDLYIETTMTGDPLGAPVRNVMGNHEVVGVRLEGFSPDAPEWGKDLYRRMLGPATYAFVYAGYHFIVLDATRVVDGDYAYGLTDASADWAVAYLQGLEAGERIVLASHEGYRAAEPEWRLLDALKDKRLAVSIYGHGHGRNMYPWGGAPCIMGGAVSYAWLGLVPFPPQPYGYSLMRFGEDGMEDQCFLDWAEERSFDITSPPQCGTYGAFPTGYPGYVSGEVKVEGGVSDLDGSVTGVSVAVDDIKAEAAITESTALKKRFEATLDLSALADGTRDFVFTAQCGDEECVERQPVVVLNGKPTPLEDPAPATLRFHASGDAGIEVIVNDTPVAELAPDELAAGQVEVAVPGEVLNRLNAVEFRAPGDEGTPTVNRVWLISEGRESRDARFSPLITQHLRAVDDGSRRFVTYIDLQYNGWAAQ